MKSFRDQIKKSEDLIFQLEQPLILPANNAYQNRGECKFVVDKPFIDWYNARLSIDFKLTKLTGANVTFGDNNGLVNGANSFVKKIDFEINGRHVYQCNDANQAVNIKNLLDYDNSFVESIGTNEFFHLDKINAANENKYSKKRVQHVRNDANTGWASKVMLSNEDPSFNEGFSARKKQLGISNTVNGEIPLSRYSFLRF